ncbi:MAG: hypothetical protein IH620_05325 [Ignavibacterium sp.]|nr:hypothetical protein [Ignavibacterium sp.]
MEFTPMKIRDSELGIWLSVDPLADKYPGWSPYNYCVNNPVLNIDPNGMDWYINNSGGLHWYDGKYEDDKTPEGYSWLGNDNYFNNTKMYEQLRELGTTSFNLTDEQSKTFAKSFGFVLAPYNMLVTILSIVVIMVLIIQWKLLKGPRSGIN